MTDRLLDFQLSTIGGTEDVVDDELQSVLRGRVSSVRIERGEVGRVFLHTEASPLRLLQLACPTRIDAIVGKAYDVTVGRPGLERILGCVGQLPTDTMRRLAAVCDRDTSVDCLQLRVSVRGNHRFAAAELEELSWKRLSSLGWRQPRPDDGTPVNLGIHVRRRRALMTMRLGPRRPDGDPTREGWSGPALACVARMLDLDDGPRVGATPSSAGSEGLQLQVWPGQTELSIRADPSNLPLMDGCLGLGLAVVTDSGQVSTLAEVIRSTSVGGIAAVLVPRADVFAARLRTLDLPLEVLATVPFHVRRRRWALFLLQRMEWMGIGPVR